MVRATNIDQELDAVVKKKIGLPEDTVTKVEEVIDEILLISTPTTLTTGKEPLETITEEVFLTMVMTTEVDLTTTIDLLIAITIGLYLTITIEIINPVVLIPWVALNW